MSRTGNLTTPDLLRNLPFPTVISLSIVSQLRQHLVPNSLYVYLVPTKKDIGHLGYNGATYLKGGIIDYALLDYLNVDGKHRYDGQQVGCTCPAT